MKAHATLKNVNSESCKLTIIRNLNRILDIRIIDIDVENGILHFLCNGQKAYEQVKRELGRIGHPILKSTKELVRKTESPISKSDLSFSIGGARRPYLAID